MNNIIFFTVFAPIVLVTTVLSILIILFQRRKIKMLERRIAKNQRAHQKCIEKLLECNSIHSARRAYEEAQNQIAERKRKKTS